MSQKELALTDWGVIHLSNIIDFYGEFKPRSAEKLVRNCQQKAEFWELGGARSDLGFSVELCDIDPPLRNKSRQIGILTQ